jgi:hypothetical protein
MAARRSIALLAGTTNSLPLIIRLASKNVRETEDTMTNDQRFPLGLLVMTPGARDAISEADQAPYEFLARHAAGDWGELSDDDKCENELSLAEGFRILSAYRTDKGARLWVITEADRSATTILLPEEY